jgi:hypothetical protein
MKTTIIAIAAAAVLALRRHRGSDYRIDVTTLNT